MFPESLDTGAAPPSIDDIPMYKAGATTRTHLAEKVNGPSPKASSSRRSRRGRGGGGSAHTTPKARRDQQSSHSGAYTAPSVPALGNFAGAKERLLDGTSVAKGSLSKTISEPTLPTLNSARAAGAGIGARLSARNMPAPPSLPKTPSFPELGIVGYVLLLLLQCFGFVKG